MNIRKIGALTLTLAGTYVAFQNFFFAFTGGLKPVQRMYYVVLGIAVLFLSAGAFYVFKKEK